MEQSTLRPHSYMENYRAKIILLLIMVLPIIVQAANGPTVNQLRKSFDSAWNTLLKVTNCNLKSPQGLLCIEKYHGETITVRLFGQQVNALILSEVSTATDVTGLVITQQYGFLIGPVDGSGYKVVSEIISHGSQDKRNIVDNGLKISAHPIDENGISSHGVGLNVGRDWLDGKDEPWIYHWSSLARVNETLQLVERHLTK